MSLGDFAFFIHERLMENSYSNIGYSFRNRKYSIFEYYSYSLDTLFISQRLSAVVTKWSVILIEQWNI